MKKMAGLQMSVVTDPKSKQAIEKQIWQWEENLEKLYMEQYRLRCYMASLQGSELPNPKVCESIGNRGVHRGRVRGVRTPLNCKFKQFLGISGREPPGPHICLNFAS